MEISITFQNYSRLSNAGTFQNCKANRSTFHNYVTLKRLNYDVKYIFS